MNISDIKFRGKCLETGKWVVGTGITDFLNSYPDDKLCCIWSDYSWIKIDPSTVGQFTGLQDKSGVDIYTGDLLDFDPIEWGDNQLVKAPEKVVPMFGDWLMCGGLADVSVYRAIVGNINDNPDLLGDNNE